MQRRRRGQSPAPAYHRYTYVTNCGDVVSKKKLRLQVQRNWALDYLVIGQQRWLTLPRQTFGQFPPRGVILGEIAIVVHVSIRRRGIVLEFRRVRASVWRIYDVLVHRQVVPPSIPGPPSYRATVGAPRRLGHLRWGQREARIAPLWWWCRERVLREHGAHRVRRGRGRDGTWGYEEWRRTRCEDGGLRSTLCKNARGRRLG
jgi:hypothetical protein